MQLIQLELDMPLRRGEIHGFRGRIAEYAGWREDLFHNHRDGAADRYQYRYPLIQYQVKGGRALVLGINEGARALQCLVDPDTLLFCGEWSVTRRTEEMRPLEMTERPRRYALQQWLALNEENYRRWDALREQPEAQRIELERILTAHILAFARAVGFEAPRPRGLELRLETVETPRQARYHGAKLLSFDVAFEANILLPRGVGIGKGASHGFGILLPAPAPRKRQEPYRESNLEPAW